MLIAKARIPPLIVTLGTLGMALGLAQVITGGVDLRDVPFKLVDTIGIGQLFGQVPWLVRDRRAVVAVVFGVVLALHPVRPLHATRSAPTPRRRGARASTSTGT